jgi:adenylyltransferase/sulfurtransferase
MNTNNSFGTITACQLKAKLDSGQSPFILDVREKPELAIACLNNTLHIPMGEVSERLDELIPFKDRQIVVYCRSGARSAHCARFLAESGFQHVLNLQGGILAWSDTVDPSMPKY